jgi:hypothetical protein
VGPKTSNELEHELSEPDYDISKAITKLVTAGLAKRVKRGSLQELPSRADDPDAGRDRPPLGDHDRIPPRPGGEKVLLARARRRQSSPRLG